MDTLLHTAEHLACAHSHVVYGDIAALRQVSVREEQVCHEVYNIAAGEVSSCLLAERLRETLDEVLKHIAAVNCAYLVRPEIALLRVEFLDNEVESVALHHTVYDSIKIELCKHVLYVG